MIDCSRPSGIQVSLAGHSLKGCKQRARAGAGPWCSLSRGDSVAKQHECGVRSQQIRPSGVRDVEWVSEARHTTGTPRLCEVRGRTANAQKSGTRWPVLVSLENTKTRRITESVETADYPATIASQRR